MECNEPEKPEPMSRDLVMKRVSSATIHLLECWLKEKAELPENSTKTLSDIFTHHIRYDLIMKDWGVEKVRQTNREYQKQQASLRKAYIAYENSLDK